MSIETIYKRYSKEKLLLLFVAPFLTAGLLTYLLIHSFYFQVYEFHGISYNKEAPDFELTSHNGNVTHLADMKGDYVLITFGYTNCPDVCPTTLSALNNTVKELSELKDDVRVLFITVDPERDDQTRLSEYIPFFNKSFLGLTGGEDRITEIASSYSVFFEKEYNDSKAGYFMNHTPAVYLVDRTGKLSLIYPYDRIDPEKIALDIKHMDREKKNRSLL